jgi:HEAT repeat protein
VRAACYESLGLLKDEAAIELLAKGVAKDSPTPAIEAAQALAAIGNAKARAALEELTKAKLAENVLEAVNRALDEMDFGK